MNENATTSAESIAVIGMSGRFPGAGNPEEFWRVLTGGIDAIERFDPSVLEFTSANAEDLRAGRRFVGARGTLADVDKFDAAFFGIYPKEASLMDPQHRFFLECAWEALESAGHDPAAYPGLIGVYAGVSLNTYLLWNLGRGRLLAGNYQVGEYQTMLGNDKDFMPVRVSYKLNLRGPSMGIQCACSTSLVAICQAATSLLTYQCDMALAGGSSITFPQRRDYPFEPDAMVSADGACRAFDAGANGTIFGHGCGVVLLKRLRDALADRDPVLAVIRGWAVNNDGSDKVGFAAPSVKAQADVIAMAQAMAGVHPRDVSYIEAHGTGTPLGDPIEVAALTEAFRSGGATGNGYCALGTGKTHIGHLDVAAGAAGVIKTILQFRNGLIPALRTYTAPNPRIDFANSPFAPVAAPLPWPRGDRPRIAGVSAFGVGGTNAHVVMEEPPAREPSGPGHDRELLVLSARTPAALDAMTARLARHIESEPGLDLADAAYTLATGRRRFAFRRAIVARDSADAATKLKAAVGAPAAERAAHAAARPIVFLMPGQGAQFVGMGQALYEREPVFREAIDACASVLRDYLGVDLRETLYPSDGERTEAEKRIHETWLTQPAIFTVEYAMARLWMAWGIQPAMVMGHSVGEYVAAVIAGTFTLRDALRLLARRARLMMDQPSGSMLAVRMSAEEVTPFLPDGVSVAAINSPKLCTVSGPTPAIQSLQATLEARGAMARLLPTSHAFHSSMMDAILEPFAAEAATTRCAAPAVPWISTCLGREMKGEDLADASYWARQLRQPVLFGQAIEKAFAWPDAVLLEVGPGQALAQFARQHPAKPGTVDVIASLPGQEGADRALDDAAQALAQLWMAGCEPDWGVWFGSGVRYRVALPTYPFERQRFWVEASPDDSAPLPALDAAPEKSRTPAAQPAAEARGGGDTVLQEVMAILQDLSGMEASALAADRSFLEMGFDSLFLTQVSLAFQKKFLVKVTLRQMLDDLSSPAAIARHIAANRPAAASAPSPSAAADEKLSLAQAGPFGPETAPAVPPSGTVTRHGPFAPINKSVGDALTPRQQQHLQALIERYTARTRSSKEHTQRHRAHFSDPRAVAGFRVMWKEITYPVVSSRSAGSKIWDLDGNEFLDVTMGFGTYLFGHNPEFIRRAIEKQLQTGIEIGPQNALAGDVARTVCEWSGMDRATFCTTGSEAVMGAVRAARTVTGRNKIVYFAGDYHGIHEEVLAKGQWVQGKSRTVPIAPGIPMELVSQVHVLNYGEPASLEWIRTHADDLAAVLVEPVQSRKPELQPGEFLVALRELTQERGIALIFDEIVTGFRIHQRGAQAWYGVRADLATYGKIVGGGLPIGVIAGKRAYLDAFDGGLWQYGDASVPEAGVTFFAGTFVRHPLAMAAARAVLDHLAAEGPGLQEGLNARTAALAARLNAIFDAEGLALHVNHCGSIWHFSHGEAFRFYSLMFHFLRERGIHIWEGRPCFMSTAHTEADIERLVTAFQDALASMREGGFLPMRAVAIPESGAFPLTDAQQEIWLTSRMDDSALPAYNESCALTFAGAMNRPAMESALARLVERHEALRTAIAESGEQQIVQDAAPPVLAWSDLSGSPPPVREQELDALVRQEVRLPFDLSRAPLLRAQMVRLEPERHVLLLTVHHLVCDGWSYDVMTRDLSTLYSLACRGERDERPLPAQFRAYARLLATYRAEPRYEADMAYWTQRLTSPPEAVRLPVDRPRPALRTFEGAMAVAPVEGALLESIKDLGAQKRCTLFATLLALYAVLLHRLTGQQEFVVGIPAAGQQMMDDHDLVGHCANLLPLRLRVDPGQSFGELLATAQRALLDAYEHQGITFGAILQALQLPRDPSRPPLIQVTFNVDPAIHGLRFEGLETDVVINPRAAYQFEHSLNIVAYANHLRIECNYNTDLFDESTIQRWLGHFRELARAVTRAPDLAVGAIRLLTDAERRVQLEEWNRTVTPYPNACIHELFEDVARAQADRIAVASSGQTLTYGDLNRKANRLARRLVQAGVRPDGVVGICAERSLEMVVGVLGILKAGGAYMPLDPAHPRDRHRLQVEDGQVKVIVGQGRFEDRFAGLGPAFVALDDDAEWRSLDAGDLSAAERGAPHRAGQLAYVMYTSGSTGQPKGVLIEHRSVVRLVKGVRYVQLGPDECIAHIAPLAFDASTFEFWGALLNGGRLAMLPAGPFSMDSLARFLAGEGITTMFMTTSLFHTLVDERVDALGSVRQLLTGGEVTSGVRIARALARHPHLSVIHCYGPTESTTFALTEAYHGGDSVEDPPPLGRPIENTQAYVLDGHLQPVPVGVIGELCLGGDGLARGYLNREEATAAAFVRNPLDGTPGERLYRTGDLARLRPDGRVEFCGRRDDQVKIRGFRIEPGEIEAALATHPAVRACAVVVRSDAQGDRQLVAHMTAADPSTAPTTEELRGHLRGTLPDFMIPSSFSWLDALPLTASGKVDRVALERISAAPVSHARAYEGPVTEQESRVAEIWSQLLGLPRVGRQDDFFALGGHSLLALKMITKLRDAGFALEVADLFRHPTVAHVAAVMKPLDVVRVSVNSDDFVVRLKEGRPGHPPLCLLPSDFGDLLIYSNMLSLLDPAIPCIGLQFPRMYEDDQGIQSMADLARFFMKHLLRVQPTGPFLLAGYCFGGHVALELANQLRAEGHRVDMLALIDARPYRPAVERGAYLRMVLRGALRARSADWRRSLSARYKMMREGALIDRLARTSPERLDRRDLNRWVLEQRTLTSYRSVDYAGPITYFYPDESQYLLYDDPSFGWLYMADRVDLHKVTGSHLNMMKEPHVRILVQHLQASIRRLTGG